MDEPFFHKALDAAVSDCAARWLLGEYLVARGDERALGYAWMAREGKYPYGAVWHGGGEEGRYYSWWCYSGNGWWCPPKHAHLPPNLWGRAEVQFPGRRNVEDALATAIAQIPQTPG